MNQNDLKKSAAGAALKYIENDMTIGVGSGSTVNYFIDVLATIKSKIKGCVASSLETEKRLKAHGIAVYDLNAVDNVAIYIDGADEFNQFKYLIKGGGGALTREKILATAAKKFICIVDASKECKVLGQFPLPIEVIPMARGLVARALVKLGGIPEYRAGFITDNGNILLDVHRLDLANPIIMEETLNNITGVVCNGIFARRAADKILIATEQGIREIN
ncbi:MAG TPA: ribose-5-phosphate isomerase RpiA [Coxiellaceae bacterium]|nr:ribose-5-phosphate isomerase RpiA [Coxiellaceae bacterium]